MPNQQISFTIFNELHNHDVYFDTPSLAMNGYGLSRWLETMIDYVPTGFISGVIEDALYFPGGDDVPSLSFDAFTHPSLDYACKAAFEFLDLMKEPRSLAETDIVALRRLLQVFLQRSNEWLAESNLFFQRRQITNTRHLGHGALKYLCGMTLLANSAHANNHLDDSSFPLGKLRGLLGTRRAIYQVSQARQCVMSGSEFLNRMNSGDWDM
jgi:hypothetical protein